MSRFRFADVAIHCDFPLFHLPVDPACGVPAYWNLVRDRSPRSIAHFERERGNLETAAITAIPEVVRDLRGWVIRYGEGARFRVDLAQRSIVVTALAQLAPETLNHLIIDSLLPRLLAQEGRYLLHCAAVEIGGRVVLLAGRSGAGKSTLAAWFDAHGHRVLSDDCVELSSSSGRVYATPTYRSLRVWTDTFDAVYGPDASLTASIPSSADSMKRHLCMRGADAASGRQTLHPTLPVAAFFQVDRSIDGTQDFRVERLGPSATQGQLLRHAFSLTGGGRERMQQLLDATMPIAIHIPGFALRYPTGFEHLDHAGTQITRALTNMP